MMGLKPSSYFTTHSMVLVEEFIQVCYYDCDNPLHCLNIRLNFLGYSKYSPSLPWVSNLTKVGNLAADFLAYIDDIRSIASSEEDGWVVGRSIATYCTYLGIQDDTRKRRLPSKTHGAQEGSTIPS